jgi:hypothetical protein
MPNYDLSSSDSPGSPNMFDTLRDDCDMVNLAGSAELRLLGARRRTNAQWAMGGAAVIVVAVGVASGVALHHPGSKPATQVGAPTTSAPCLTGADTLNCVVVDPSTTATATAAPTHATSAPPTYTVTPPATSAAASACAIADFDVARATIQSDDASGITGYDVVIAYTGTKSCKLSQAATLSYRDGSGHRVLIPLSASAAPIMVKPHHSVTTSVFGPNDQGINPPPAACAQPHVYAGLDVRIDGRQRSLGSRSITLPCGGAKTLAWSIA